MLPVILGGRRKQIRRFVSVIAKSVDSDLD
jgi:hypothetical protein